MTTRVKTSVQVISMVTAQRRRQQFSATAENAEIDWEFFSALRLPAEPLAYDEGLAVRRFGRPLKPGEIGCYASHFAVWQAFLDSPATQLIVFEDDVIVDWQAIQTLARQDLAAHGIDVLKLFATHPIDAKVVKYKLLSDHSHLLRLRGYTYGTQGYMLSKRAAQALIEHSKVMYMPVDWAMSRYWDYGLPNYASFPFPLFERQGQSSIEHSQSAPVSATPSSAAARFAWKLSDRMKRFRFDFAANDRSQFGPPSDAGQAFLTDASSGTR